MSFILDVNEDESNSPLETTIVRKNVLGELFIELPDKYNVISLRFEGTYQQWGTVKSWKQNFICIIFSQAMTANLNWCAGDIVHIHPVSSTVVDIKYHNY